MKFIKIINKLEEEHLKGRETRMVEMDYCESIRGHKRT